MAVAVEELTQDTVPEGGPFSDIKEEAGSLFDRMKAKRASAQKAVKAGEPKAPRDTKPRETKPKISATQAKTNHERRKKKITGIVGNIGLGVTVAALARPHSHFEIVDGVRVKTPDDLYMRDAKAIVDGSEVVGEQWATLADTNETVAKYIDALSTSSAWAGAIASLLVIAIPILANHGKIPQGMADYFTPEYIINLLDKAKEEVKDS